MYQVLKFAKSSQRFVSVLSKLLGNILPHFFSAKFLCREYPTNAKFLVPGRVFPLLTFHAQYVTLIVNRKGFKNEITRCPN